VAPGDGRGDGEGAAASADGVELAGGPAEEEEIGDGEVEVEEAAVDVGAEAVEKEGGEEGDGGEESPEGVFVEAGDAAVDGVEDGLGAGRFFGGVDFDVEETGAFEEPREGEGDEEEEGEEEGEGDKETEEFAGGVLENVIEEGEEPVAETGHDDGSLTRVGRVRKGGRGARLGRLRALGMEGLLKGGEEFETGLAGDAGFLHGFGESGVVEEGLCFFESGEFVGDEEFVRVLGVAEDAFGGDAVAGADGFGGVIDGAPSGIVVDVVAGE
jgi:hypothetical protein